jgi:hypothetical protein
MKSISQLCQKLNMPDLKRVERELRQCKTDTVSNVTVEPINDNLCHLVGILSFSQKAVLKDRRELAMREEYSMLIF